MGASAFLKSVDFTAFAVNVKTIALGKYLYQFGHAIWWNNMPMPVFTFLEEYDFSGKTVISFTTYGNGGCGKSVDSIRDTLPDATILDGLAIQEHELQDAPADVSEWLKELGLIKWVDKMKAKIKIIIDAGMIILVLMQMAYHLIGDSLHGWIGMILFALIILHNVVDRRWYLGLCKGKYTPVRFFHSIINLLLLASFLCLAVSVVFLSTTLSTFFHLKAVMIGRRMHIVFTAWSFVLMSVHVRLHWNRGIGALKKLPQGVQHLLLP